MAPRLRRGIRHNPHSRQIGELAGIPCTSAPDKFMALAAHDALVDLLGRLAVLTTASYADARGVSLREAVLALDLLGAEEFDAKVNPQKMLFPFVTKPG